ncbi:hypothetical protein PS918_03136 [Pseudomonas fluorescens]|uniref:DUF6575 domain-containing protein n=1 Tax=Pseudomonas fluorescens TaxID=294 RepID=A0A5E7SUB3_PSEFL|nr:DUF6575 domain-containing protein [Pseudomonas fluorescens]VVP89959.1 hypothetical protein PS918_03136 [Pseudomonas fluorescens]
MKAIQLLHVLLDYDYPQVFVARDAIGVRYVCMVAEEVEHGPVFLCVPVSDYRCRELLTGKIDLRHVYENPELSEFYQASPDDLTEPFGIELTRFNVAPQDWLPDPGLVFQYDDEVLIKAQELNATVAFASLAVPEASHEARIRTRKLSEFLAIYQGVLRNLARVAAKSNGKAIPKGDEPYESDVFGFCPGSFTVQVRSAESCDMLGENKALISAFTKLNEFLALADKPDEAVRFLLGIKGHAASSLISLLNFIAENDCPFANTWSTPGMRSSSKSKIRVASAQNVIQRCRHREDLGVEDIALTGIVDSAKVSTSTWRIDVDGVAYSGGIKDGSNLNLAGITVGNRYTFHCQEKIEIVHGTGREVKIISLVRFEPA